MHSLPLTLKCKQAEWTLIQLIALNNNFPQKLIQNLNQQIQRKKNTNQGEINWNNKNKKCTTFTYYSPKVRKITNLFKNTNIGISFKITNTLQQLTKPKQPAKHRNSTRVVSINSAHAKWHTLDKQALHQTEIPGRHNIYKTTIPIQLMHSTS